MSTDHHLVVSRVKWGGDLAKTCSAESRPTEEGGLLGYVILGDSGLGCKVSTGQRDSSISRSKDKAPGVGGVRSSRGEGLSVDIKRFWQTVQNLRRGKLFKVRVGQC